MDQIDLFDRNPPRQNNRRDRIRRIESKRPPPKDRRLAVGIERRWTAFRRAHPHVFDRALQLAREQLAKQPRPKRIGVGALWEQMRGKVGVALDNTMRRPMARDLIEAEPRLVGLIELRRRRRP